jgi:hypothetical protein
MGLDSFTSDDSSLKDADPSESQETSDNSKSNGTVPKTTAFKTIGEGASSLKFQTEEEWETFVEFIENGLGFDIDRVLSWTEEKQRDFLGHAHSFRSDELFIDEHTVTQECIVCGREFTFPHDWDFILFNHQAVCPSHPIGEAAEAYDRKDNT